MNVLLLTQFFSTTKGGGEYVFSLIAKALADSRNNVWVITNKIKGESYQSNKNIKIIFVPPQIDYQGGLPSSFSENLRYSINAIVKGVSLIRKEKIDIIHSNNFAPALAGSFQSTLTNKPHITTVHDVFSLCGDNYWESWGKQTDVSKLSVKLAPFFEKMILRLKHEAIHTVSQTTKDDLIKFGAKKPIYVIPNTIEIKNTEESKSAPMQFIAIGRLVFYKNLEVVLKAIKIVKNKFPQIKLIVIGGGPYRKNLEKFSNELEINENVEFTDYVSEEKKMELLSSSQALLFPSLCEGFGLVILEAFSQKKPVLVSDVPPLSEIVVNEENGYVIPPHDETEWAKKIIEIVENPENANLMGQSGFRLLEKKYTHANMLNYVLKMYNEIKR